MNINIYQITYEIKLFQLKLIKISNSKFFNKILFCIAR